ncbi:MAG: hypothetical protein U0640_01875 [Phycisphaerales bacterium]
MRTSLVCTLGGVFALSSCAFGQWSAVSLAPPPSGSPDFQNLAWVYGAGGSRQVGYQSVNGAGEQAVMWSGTAGSRTVLSPVQSQAYGAGGNQQVGIVYSFGNPQAALWTGSSQSQVILHPAGATQSSAVATTGSRQVGHARIGGVNHAALWSGTAASFVDLTPNATADSQANVAIPGRQGGFVRDGFDYHAAVWSGTAASLVDLHPAEVGATWSFVNGLTSTQQFGTVYFSTTQLQASMWTGSASSWVSLHPDGAIGSQIDAAIEGFQVGRVQTPQLGVRAALWSGTSEWFDLSSVQPPTFHPGLTIANGISTDGINIYVTGQGFNNLNNRTEPLLWIRPVPSGSSVAVLSVGIVALLRRRRN